MNSYGDPNGTWAQAFFHAGIDIDATTGDPQCNEVRSVAAGYATTIERITISPGVYEWIVIICDELDGVAPYGWCYGHLTQPGFIEEAYVAQGQLIGYMSTNVTPAHLHFMWSDWDENPFSWVNPLKYLSPAPTSEDDFVWEFNPESTNPPFGYFFLPQIWYEEWEDLSVEETEQLMLDPDLLFDNVDFFFGIALRGDGMPGGTGTGRNDLAAQKIKYDVVRELAGDEQTLDIRYVVDFDCALASAPSSEPKAQMLYFKYQMLPSGLVYCLSNSYRDSENWNGINTIADLYWNTDAYSDGAGDNENPVLAMYPDGEYRLDVTCYSFDEDVTYPASIEVELHNYYPALREVSILDAETDQVYYHAEWEPGVSGTSAELNVTVDQPVTAGTPVQVILIFTETMDTSSLSASLGSASLGTGSWDDSEVSNDIWVVETAVPNDPGVESLVLSVSASDLDENDLMNPDGAGSFPGTPDTNHELSFSFGAAEYWTESVHAPVLGSPKLEDMDDDGDLDVVVQCSDGWIHVLDDDGTSMTGWPVSGGWSSGNPIVLASPAIVNLIGVSSSAPEILAVHPYGCNGFLSSGSAISPWNAVFPGIFRWFALSSPVAGDLTVNGNNDFVIGRQHEVEYPYGTYVDINLLARSNTGSALWDTNYGEEFFEQSVSSTPSICDADADGEMEVLFVTDDYISQNDSGIGTVYCVDAATGDEEWSTYVGGELILGAVTAANLDGDDALEIVVGATSGSNYIKVLNGSNGALQHSLAISGGTYAGASIADVDGNGTLDIVASSSGGMLYCWDGSTGNSISGFPVDLDTWTRGGVSIGDIDLDGELELVMAGRDGKLYAVNHDGSMAAGFPITVSSNPLSGQPALGDIDGDGRLEILFGEEGNSVVHCYQLADNSAFTYLPWPQFQRDAQNTGAIELDTTNPEPPTDFDGTGSLSGGDVLTVDLSWTLSVNDPYNPDAVPLADVVSYRIYRKIPPRDIELIGTISAGTDNYTDVIYFTSLPPQVVAYFACAWDGTNESILTDVVKIILYSNGNIARDSRIREIANMAAIDAPSSASIAGSDSRLDHSVGGNCRVLTDGNHDTVYMPSSSARCVEIDLGAMFDVTDVAIIRSDLSLMESMRLELSTDGTSFRAVDSGRTRYVRVYGAGGASEIEVMGTPVEGASIPIEIVREEQGFFRIASAEEGTPMTVSVFDLAGRRVWDGTSSSGEVLWNRRTSTGTPVPTGVYLLLIETDGLDPVTSRIVVR
jgi:hypothetical protein